MEIRNLEIRPDEQAVDRTVLHYMRSYAQGRDEIAILEAGCGRRWPYDLSGLRYVLTGVDVNADALRIRQQDKKDLHHIVLGDLRTVHFEPQCFDIIYSAFVLEHVPQAGLVLANFLKWLKPGGLLILKFPDRDSVYGFVTRVTPFWFHVLYKRYLVGNPNAGKPGYGPFPTVHEEIIGRRAFHAFVRQNGLIMREEYGFGTLPGLQGLVTKALAALSFGKLAANYYNLLYVLETPAAFTASRTEARHGALEDAPGVFSINLELGESGVSRRAYRIDSSPVGRVTLASFGAAMADRPLTRCNPDARFADHIPRYLTKKGCPVHDRTTGDETQSPTRRRDTSPRVLLVSQRSLSDQVANACLYQFEDLICALDEVDLIAPGRSVILPGKLYKVARWCGVPRPLARALTLRPQVAEPAREYELLIAVLDSYRQVATVNTIKQWRRHCHKAICFFPEIWPRDIDPRNSILELFDVFDHIFVGVDHCSEALTKLIGRPCTNLHAGVDALQFCPWPSIRRSIDVCYIGRRSEVTHQRLLALAEDKGLFYYYDTTKGNLRIADHRAHRLLFANLVKRSRYFIANYAKIDRPDQTGGKQEVGYRFFEGVAGGAVLLGQPPATAAFRRLFPWPDAVIEIPFDAPGIVEVIAGLDGDPARTARIRAANVANALRLHDWVYRYEEMLAVAGLAPTPAMADRRARLQALADRFEHVPVDEAAGAPRRVPA